MIHTALWVASALFLTSIGGSILVAIFLFVSTQKQEWDRELRWRNYWARVEAEEAVQQAAGQRRPAQQVGTDLLDALEKIDAGFAYGTKDNGRSWIH